MRQLQRALQPCLIGGMIEWSPLKSSTSTSTNNNNNNKKDSENSFKQTPQVLPQIYAGGK